MIAGFRSAKALHQVSRKLWEGEAPAEPSLTNSRDG
jgi:hypothetical protein